MTVLILVTIIRTVGLHWINYSEMIQPASVGTVSHLRPVSCRRFMKIRKKMSALESIILTGLIFHSITIYCTIKAGLHYQSLCDHSRNFAKVNSKL